MARSLPLLLVTIAAPAFAQSAPPAMPSGGISAGQDETRAQAEAKATTMFERLDLNHDGFVTMDELKAIFAKRMGVTPDKLTSIPPMAQAMMDDADLNHDGKVTLEEAKASALKSFDEADANHDGIVTPDERMAFAQKVSNEVHPQNAVGR